MRMMMLWFTLVLVGCSNSPTVNVNNTGGAAMKEKDTANGVKSYATKTMPPGAKSVGMMTSPRAGNTTIPIVNVEVYTFTANIDDDATGEVLYWALTPEAVYVWGAIDLVCVDDDGFETGETGVADFIYEADEFGYGWMVATDSCGYSTFFGCSADAGGPETCGGCDFDSDYIVCAAASE